MAGPESIIDLTKAEKRDVCTSVLRFQTLEHVDEPRAENEWSDDTVTIVPVNGG